LRNPTPGGKGAAGRVLGLRIRIEIELPEVRVFEAA